MTAAYARALSDGACVDLPAAVVDKYLWADPRTARFNYLTGKAICGHCVVRTECLAVAIELPSVENGIRGGESPNAVSKLRTRYLAGEAGAFALAAEAVSVQPVLGGLLTAHGLRAGRFGDAEWRSDPVQLRRRSG